MIPTSLYFLAAICSSQLPPVTNEELLFREKTKDATTKRLAEDRVRLRYLRREEVSLLEGIKAIDSQLLSNRKKMRGLTKRKDDLEIELKTAKVALEEQETVVDSLREEIRKRASSVHRLRRKPVMDMILEGTDQVAERARTRRRLADYMSMVFAYDMKLISELHKRLTSTKRLHVALLMQNEALQLHQKNVQQAVQDGAALQLERSALLLGIKKERKLVERLRKEIKQAAKQSEQLRKVIRGVIPAPPKLKGGFGAQRGRLPWPVVGRVEVSFGKQVDPDSGLIILHQGLDIRTPYGVAVSPVAEGRIEYAGKLDGLGSVVVISHEGRWHTVYGHLANIQVREGQFVRTKSILGTVSDRDSNKGAFLYFEIRDKQQAVNPIKWMSPG
ncbi:MAG: peptidoglycan DD-metalloendopeptidase family protein [Myxococcota bacterium]|nr:peptidoglycan DD-metalloendopeptidase family protein [Myxococcota bacterium]